MKRLAMLPLLLISTTLFSQTNTYDGRGDDIITVEKPQKNMPYLLTITGNAEGQYFGVTGYDKDNERTELLVNTGKPYTGIVGVDLGSAKNTVRLEIQAEGKWDIGVWPIGAAQKIKTQKSGEGDNVLWVEGNPSTAKIVGNKRSKYFGVTAYDKHGKRAKLLVNTGKPYSGKVLLPKNTLLLKIEASGKWSVELD